MSPFECVVAEHADHAVALLAQHGAAARILAGGTDLLVALKETPNTPRIVVDISRAEDMRGITLTDTGLRIGALTTHSEILQSPLIAELCPVLAEAALTIGAVQTRNMGTVGGNLVTCVPSLDSGPALVALEAQATIAGPRGKRHLPLTEFFVAPRRTALAADELLFDITVPTAALRKPAAFLKFGLRKGQALALVNVAAALHYDETARVCRQPRIALGAVAPTVVRATDAECHLEGEPLDAAHIAQAAKLAVGATRPITDFRASADYRRDLVEVLTRRALEQAYARALEAVA